MKFILGLPAYSLYKLIQKMEAENTEKEESKTPQLYEIHSINDKVDFMLVPEGIVYLVQTDGNGSGKRPIIIPNTEVNIEGIADKVMPELEKFAVNFKSLLAKLEEKGILENREPVLEEVPREGTDKDKEASYFMGIPKYRHAPSSLSETILVEIMPEIQELIGKKLEEYTELIKGELIDKGISDLKDKKRKK